MSKTSKLTDFLLIMLKNIIKSTQLKQTTKLIAEIMQ